MGKRDNGGRKGKYGQWKCSLAPHSVCFSFHESSAKLKLQSFYVTFSHPGTPSITTNLLQVIKLCWVFPTSTNAALAQHWCSYTQCSSRNGFFGEQYSPFLPKARNLLFHEELCHSNTINYLYLKWVWCFRSMVIATKCRQPFRSHTMSSMCMKLLWMSTGIQADERAGPCWAVFNTWRCREIKGWTNKMHPYIQGFVNL